jgi:HPt (histidine-containing phosphotransfer) domain-containing protein
LAASIDPSALPLLDYETLDELRLLDRVKPGLLDQLIERFEAKRLGQLAALEQAMADQRWPEVKTLAHSLKGGAGSIGLIELSRLAAQLESDPQALIRNPGLLGALTRGMDEGMGALRAWRDQ